MIAIDATEAIIQRLLYGGMRGLPVLPLVFGCLYLRERRKYLGIWTLYFGLTSAAFVLLLPLLNTPSGRWIAPIHLPLYLLGTFFLVQGTHDYLEREPSTVWVYITAVAVALGLAGALGQNDLTSAGRNAAFFLAGVMYLGNGKLFLGAEGRTVPLITGLSSLAVGVITILHPYLQLQEWFNPWGTVLSGGLGLVFGLGLISSHYEQPGGEPGEVEQGKRDRGSSKVKLEKLHETALKLSQISTEEEVYKLIVETTTGILDYSLCTFGVVEGDYLVVKATTKETRQHLRISEGVAGRTFRNKKTYLINNIHSDSEARPKRNSYRSGISTPVGDIGVFQVVSTRTSGFDQEDVRLVELLANHAAEAIKRIRSENQIRHMSFHDSLTGLYNRAYIETELDRLDTRRQLPISVIMGDLNSLKLVNDSFGHTEGDELIKKAARAIRDACRSEDIVGRWGGDEFIILLPQTSMEETRSIVERIKERCRDFESVIIPLSIAFGYATKESPEQDSFEVLKLAEDSMYKNKLNESQKARNTIFGYLRDNLVEKSGETGGHASRMQELARRLGEGLGLSETELDKLSLLVTLHDIGKIAVPERILNHPGPLTIEDWSEVKRHPEVGYRIARSSEDFAHVAEEILSHHEHWDGSGYPRGLKGEEIPKLARIVAIIDSYDVLTSERPYKSALSPEKALRELEKGAGTQFDPRLVGEFRAVIDGT